MESKSQDRKEIDINGFITYLNNPISKAGVFEYLGSEIGAPEPSKIYRVYRPEEELSKEETIESFELMPLLDDHTFLGNEGESPEKVGVQGAISNIHYEAPYLKADIMVYSNFLKNQIQAGKVELSPSYRCKYVFEEGTTPEGEQYDAIQTNLVGNHLALVDQGRTGPDVRVYDSCPVGIINSDSFNKEVSNMEFTEEQLAQIRALIKEVLAENVADEEVKEDEVKDELTTEEAEVTEEEVEAVKEDVEEAAAISQEVVEEALAKVEELEDKVNQVADAKTIIKEVNKRNKLIERVVPFIGVFDADSMFTEQDVAVYACDKLNIKVNKGSEISSLNGWLQGAKLEKVTDSKVNVRSSQSKLWSK